MPKSASKRTYRHGQLAAKGKESSILRRRSHSLARRFGFPAELVGGSLTLTHRRCGKAGCHCASGEGHALWTLTYSSAGEKTVLPVPAGELAALQPLVVRGREYRDALAELLAINAQLVRLWFRQQSARRRKKRPR